MSDLPSAAKDAQNRLKALLQASKADADKFENMTAALIGRLLGVPVFVARSGFQYGGDGGTAGQAKRRLRVETKKYGDTTSLSERELLGELDQAVKRDPALEVWILAATRVSPEQLTQELTQKGEKEGVPVLVLDWDDAGLAPMAALCASAPDIVETLFSVDAGQAAREIEPHATSAIELIRHRLQSWELGFETIRRRSHVKLTEIWTMPRIASAELAQDVAGGGEKRKTIRRANVHAMLGAWWDGKSKDDAPAVAMGWDGVGKTWAVLDWLMARRSEQPIVLVAPSSAAVRLAGATPSALKRFIAERLHELTSVRDVGHWVRRVETLLERPAEEGPVFTLYLDGLNQEPSVPWLQILKVLQGPPFQGRVRVIISTRSHHFEAHLGQLRGLVVKGEQVPVEPYDLSPGGELDQMLALEGVNRADLHDDLVELARIPRLFSLVMRLRDRLNGAEQITLHRVLWEFGRDTLGERAGRSFSEQEWQDWLREVAQKHRDGVREVSVKQLSEGAARPDLSEREVYGRLSDIIDGRFVTRDAASGAVTFTPAVVNHALGAALLARLDGVASTDYDAVEAELTAWLDPIAGWDAKAEIIRAAVSIFVERGSDSENTVASVLVTAWLQAQNVPDPHRLELVALAYALVPALITTVERSNPHAQESARGWALAALKKAPRDDDKARGQLFAAAKRWLSIVSRDVERPDNPDKQAEVRRAAHFVKRIGVDQSGPMIVLGVPLIFEDHHATGLPMAAPVIMDGFPLIDAWPVFEAAAVAIAIARRDDAWSGLKWVCLFNETDRAATTERLRALSKEVAGRMPEEGVHAELSARVAALLLWLTGEDEDCAAAGNFNPSIDRHFDYQKDYLSNPARSFFKIERRHAEEVLASDLPLHVRIQRVQDLLLDPDFAPPEPFVAEIRDLAGRIDVTKLHLHNSRTLEDINFEEWEPVLARCAPDLLAALTRAKLQQRNVPSKSRYWRAIHTVPHYLLAGKPEADAARELRQTVGDQDENHETYATTLLMLIEGDDGAPVDRISAVVDAGFPFIEVDLRFALPKPSEADVDALIEKYAGGTAAQKRDLICLISLNEVALSERAWAWLEQHAAQTPSDGVGVAMRMLFRTDAAKLGKRLWLDGWTWSHERDVWTNHYGSWALIDATKATPFEQVAPRLAPWLLLKAARRRGDAPEDVALAADILGRALMRELDPPDPGSTLLVDREERKDNPAQLALRPFADDRDPIAALKNAFDDKQMIKIRRRAVETAVARIKTAREKGASLYLADIQAEDFESVIVQAPDRVEAWIEGAHDVTKDFRRRVMLSEGVYLALCEALLSRDPPTGAILWRALRRTLTTRFIGAAGVDDLLHIPFRAPPSPSSLELKEHILSPVESNCDKDLFELALVARSNGQLDWIKATIAADAADGRAWRRKRAIVLSGFVPDELPIPAAWPDRQLKTEHEHLEHQAASRRWREACARHWWTAFVEANDYEAAYAAWILFMKAADRRAWTFMREIGKGADIETALDRRKAVHVELNRDRMKKALAKFDDKLDGDFLDRDVFFGVGPWRSSR